VLSTLKINVCQIAIVIITPYLPTICSRANSDVGLLIFFFALPAHQLLLNAVFNWHAIVKQDFVSCAVNRKCW
jgi:hypothetical protein